MTRPGPSSDPTTTADLDAGALSAADQSSLDARRRRAIAARQKTAAFGQIVAIMARSEPLSRMPMAELTWLLMPPVTAGQFMVASKRIAKSGMIEPAAAVMWARVSDEVDGHLSRSSTPVRLAPKAWNSGEHLWLMEAVGDPALVPQMIQHLGQNLWKGKTVKIRSRSPDGSIGVQAVGPL